MISLLMEKGKFLHKRHSSHVTRWFFFRADHQPDLMSFKVLNASRKLTLNLSIFFYRKTFLGIIFVEFGSTKSDRQRKQFLLLMFYS